jgi:hypothetical protein
MGILYAAVFLVGLAFSDLGALRVAGSAGQAVYAIDIVNAGAVALAVGYVIDGGLTRLTRSGRWYSVFLGWLLLEAVIGSTRYGGAAFGEFRYVLPLFWFFVPPAIEELRRTPPDVEYATVPMNIVSVAAFAGIVMLAIEAIHGGRYYFTSANQAKANFADFRGARYLDSYQTFNIAFASAVALLAGVRMRRPGLLPLAFVLLGLAAWTQNRTALIAVVAGLIGLAVLQRRFGLLATVAAGGGIALLLVAMLAPSLLEHLAASYSAALSPTADDSGSWRLYIQLQAVLQGLQTPVMGQGYGGYFRFEIPGREDVLAPPHNQFVVLFLKGGTVAVFLSLGALTAYAGALWKRRADVRWSPRERLVNECLLLFVVTQFAYGLAYDFVLTFGLMAGCAEVLLQRAARRDSPSSDPAREVASRSRPIETVSYYSAHNRA